MQEEEPEPDPGAPAWIVSFADMSLLLLSFFIMLLAVSSQNPVPDQTLVNIVASIKVGFGYRPPKFPVTDVDFAVLQILAEQEVEEAEDSGMEWSEPKINEPRETPTTPRIKHKNAVGKPVQFPRNSAEIPPDWQAEMDGIAEKVRHHYRMIVIQGHCSPDEAAGDGDRGDDLSFRRALAVKKAFVERGVAAPRIRLVACGARETTSEPPGALQRRAVVIIGTYYLPGGNADALQ